MVGLSVILENCRDLAEKRSPQVLSKGTMMKTPSNHSSPTTPGVFSRGKTPPSYSCYSCPFLERCFLCGQKLLKGKDIYMYNGDKAFCSEECRCRQILMDEEEASANTGCTGEYNCSLASTSLTSSSAAAAARRREIEQTPSPTERDKVLW